MMDITHHLLLLMILDYMVKTLLGLEKVPKPDDAADALAVAICHSQINPRLNDNFV